MLEPILEARSDAERRLFPASMRHTHTRASFQVSTAFMAVVSSTWPSGLVPLFSVETEEGFELRRLPMHGQENQSEPLFFALPPISETNASKLAGHWHGLASNAQRNHHSPDWQLAVEGERVAGRFDPMGEYRVAFIRGGIFRSNLLRLEIEYINDRYILEGAWKDGKLAADRRRRAGWWRMERQPERPHECLVGGSGQRSIVPVDPRRRAAILHFHESPGPRLAAFGNPTLPRLEAIGEHQAHWCGCSAVRSAR
jgi:hypothetical protein